MAGLFIFSGIRSSVLWKSSVEEIETVMEAGMSLVSCPAQFLSRTHQRTCSSAFFSVLHDQVTPVHASMCAPSLARNPSVSIPSHERCQNDRQLMCFKEETESQMLDVCEVITEQPSSSLKCIDYIQHVNSYQLEMLLHPGLWYLWPSLLQRKEAQPLDGERGSVSLEADRALSLAKEALSASLEAVSIFKYPQVSETLLDDLSLSRDVIGLPLKRTVRSTRLMERQTKKRRAPRVVKSDDDDGTRHKTKPESTRNSGEDLDMNDPFRLFMRAPETTKLLSANDESELISKIQDLMKIQKVRNDLQTQFSREPTVVELSSAIGISCRDLQSQIRIGKTSRDKLLYANFRMVIHIAKQFQGRGLGIRDLVQEGSLGLMKSVEKFKPQVGCRFGTYAYWWIRQAIRKALFQHSRTIRLPENVYGLLSKVYEARNQCIQQGKSNPSKEELASCAGMSVEKLDALLRTTRTPLSLQQPVWSDQATTFLEITADMEVEAPDVAATKHLMRRHTRNLLSFLNPRERKILRLRFGLEDGKQRSLSDIGNGLGLTKERIRQLENRAMYKLKQCLNTQGLAAYTDLLI